MSNLSNQQINQTFQGLLQVPGGITSSLQTVQDAQGNPTGLQLSSTGANVTTSDTYVASVNGTALSNTVPQQISDGFGSYATVKDFGAVGNGVTNDAVAIQNAINATEGGTLFFPEGTYYIGTTTLNLLSKSNYRFAGTNAIIKYAGSGVALNIDRKKNISIFSGTIDLSVSTGSAIALSCQGVWFLVVDQTKFIPGTSSSGGIYIEGYPGWGGSYIIQLNALDMSDNGGSYGIKTSGANGSTVTHLYIAGGWIKGKNNGIEFDGLYSGQLLGLVIESCTTYGIKVEDVAYYVFQPAEISGIGSGNAIYFDPAQAGQNYVLTPSMVGNEIDYTNYKATAFDMRKVILRGSVSPSFNTLYYAIISANYQYNNVFNITVKGDSITPETVIMQYGNGVGVTLNTNYELLLARNGVTAAKVTGSSDFVPGSDNLNSLGIPANRWSNAYAVNFKPGTGTSIWTSGANTPEGSVTAPVGSLYTRTNGGAGTTLYVKESGSGNTGWVAK